MRENFKWSEKAYKLKYISLRYFNAAGADFELAIGEDHTPETHLIPLAIRSLDKGPKLKILAMIIIPLMALQ